MTSRTSPPRRRSSGRTALVFLLPLLAVYGVYFIYSFWFLIQTSMTKVGLSFRNAVDVGLRNYQLLFEDGTFWRALVNNFLFAGVSIAVALTFAFFIAATLASGVRAKKFFYLLFLVPALMPLSLVATIFGSMMQYQFGAFNELLRGIGLDGLAAHWLTEPGLAFAVVAGVFVYVIGLPIMYYTSDLSALPVEPVEAALVDGAGTFRIMRSVVYPMMRSTHITVILSLLLGSFRALEQVLFSTGGGPGDTTEVVGTYLYRFSTQSGSTVGLVSAAAVVVLIVALLISLLQIVVARPRRASR